MTLRTVDESTGEVLRPEEWRLEQIANMLADIPDAQVIEAGALCDDLAAFYRSMADKFRGAVLDRMTERGATKLLTPEGASAMKSVTTSWIWNTDGLLTEVRPMVSEKIWRECVEYVEPPTPEPYLKANTVKLKALAKALGPEQRAIILGCATQVEGSVKVKLVPA